MGTMDRFRFNIGVACTILFILIYEWGVFEASLINKPTSVLKILLPFAILCLFPTIKKFPFRLRIYLLFFIIFMLWSFIPSIFSQDRMETITQWYKYSLRLLFFIAISSFFLHKTAAAVSAIKGLVLIGLAMFCQFVVLAVGIFSGLAKPYLIEGARGIYYGPFGILGNQTAMMQFPGVALPFLRFTGFWLEPSNASGYMMAAFFLAAGLYATEHTRIWKIASIGCLLGGILCLSNAGYLALASGLMAGAFVNKRLLSWKNITLFVLVGTFGATGLLGRYYVLHSETSNVFLKAITGARESKNDLVTDAYGGRVELLNQNIDIILNNPFGIGFRIPGEGFFEVASGSAPVLMMAYTGVLGLFLLLARESQVFLAIRENKCGFSALYKGCVQAWLCVFTQHLAYGSWMSPLYLFLSLVVLLPYWKNLGDG